MSVMDHTYRLVLCVALAVTIPVVALHRIRAHTGEPLDRRQEVGPDDRLPHERLARDAVHGLQDPAAANPVQLAQVPDEPAAQARDVQGLAPPVPPLLPPDRGPQGLQAQEDPG